MWSGLIVSRSPRESHFLVFPSLERLPTFYFIFFCLRPFYLQSQGQATYVPHATTVSNGLDPTVIWDPRDCSESVWRLSSSLDSGC